MRLFKGDTHRHGQQALSAYIDGQLGPRQREALESHLAQCASCQEELEALRQVVALLHRVPQTPVPRSFALSQAPVRRVSWGVGYVAPIRYATAVAALLLLAVAVGDLATGQPTTVAPVAAPAVERQMDQAIGGPTDGPAATVASPPMEGATTPEGVSAPQIEKELTVEQTGEASVKTAEPVPVLEEPGTADTLFRWAEVALGALLVTLAALIATQWWLGRRVRVGR